MVNIVEDEIQQLKKKVAKLELEMERTKAVTECQNLGNKYQFYLMRGMATEQTHLFALKTPGGAVEMLWGIYDGPEGIIRWKRSEGYGEQRKPGTMNIHGMCTPIIEVATDGQTARGLWMMIGTSSNLRDGKVQDKLGCAQFAMDFIKEDGEWKIWKYNTTGLINSPIDQPWHEGSQETLQAGINRPLPDEYKPDRPASYPWMWNPNDLFENIPPVPLPYETWDDSIGCVPPPGKQWDIKKK